MGKTQDELEQPAKVYQLNAVETKVDQLLSEVKQIAQSINGVVTNTQLEARLEKFEKDLKEDIATEYGPIKKGAWVVLAAVVLGIITQVTLNLLNLGGS